MELKGLKESEITALAVSVLCGKIVDKSDEQYCFVSLTSKKQSHQCLSHTIKGLGKKELEGLKPHFSEIENGGVEESRFWLSKALHDEVYSIYKNNPIVKEKVDNLTN